MLAESSADAATAWLKGLCVCRLGTVEDGESIIQAATASHHVFQGQEFLSDLYARQKKHWLWSLEKRLKEFLIFQQVDVFLISYPKCGRTWLNLLLGKYAHGEEESNLLDIASVATQTNGFSNVEVSHDDFPHWKSPGTLVEDKSLYADKRVVFLARDPRDVLVSSFFEYTRRNGRPVFQDSASIKTVSDHIRNDIGGIENLVGFYNIWARNRHVPRGFHLVTYEDMIANTGGVLCDLIAFLGWPQREQGYIEQVVQFASFDNMRHMEETDALRDPRLRVTDKQDPESFKVRKGRVGGYRAYLSDEDVAWVEQYIETHLDDFFACYKSRYKY